MASALVVLHPAWTGLAVAPFGQSLRIPKSTGGQQGRTSSWQGRSIPQVEPWGCQDVSLWGGFSPIALLTGSF